jgi:hypothetical protein
LILVTAGITGILVPVINGCMDVMRNRRQKRLALQNNLLEAQAQLLDKLASLLWSYWKLALQVAYYGKGPVEDQQKYLDAKEKYDSDQAWEVGRDIHIEISKARRLIPSRAVYGRLDAMRGLVVDDLDILVTRISDSSQDEWGELYEHLNGDVRQSIDKVLVEVALDLGLSAQDK